MTLNRRAKVTPFRGCFFGTGAEWPRAFRAGRSRLFSGWGRSWAGGTRCSGRHASLNIGRIKFFRRSGGGAFAAGRSAYDLFLNRQLSLPVLMISQWCVRRSSKAVVIFASMNTLGHSPNARFVAATTDVRSQAC